MTHLTRRAATWLRRHGPRPVPRMLMLALGVLLVISGGALVADQWFDGRAAQASAAPAAHGRGLVAARSAMAATDLPSVGHGIADAIRTCKRSLTKGTPVRGDECGLWDLSGPVNVVITTDGTPPELVLLQSGWTTAQGNWLVAGGYVGPFPRCAAGWRDSTVQLELRLDRTSRRHLKLIDSGCSLGGRVMIFANAHTDAYDARHCHGDHMVDTDRARDAVVASLRTRPGVTVGYRQDRPAGATYPGGCGQPVGTDGRVAYITVGA